MVRRATSELIQENWSEKAEQILAGAMQEFLAHGYAATSMDRVATAAKVSKATVYSHFQDKEGLFTALVQRMAEQKFGVIYDRNLLKGEPEVALRRMAEVAMRQICCDPEQLAFVRLILGEADRFPQLAQIFVRNVTKPGIEFLSNYFAAHPELNIPDPEATARIVIGAMVYFAQVQQMLHGKDIIPMEGDRLVAALMHLVLNSREKTT